MCIIKTEGNRNDVNAVSLRQKGTATMCIIKTEGNRNDVNAVSLRQKGTAKDAKENPQRAQRNSGRQGIGELKQE